MSHNSRDTGTNAAYTREDKEWMVSPTELTNSIPRPKSARFPKDTTSKRRGRSEMDSSPDTIRVITCNSIDSIQHNCEEEQNTVYRPVLSRLKSIRTEEYKAKMNDVKVNCLNPLVERTKQVMPNKEQVKSFTHEASERGQGCVFMAYEAYNQQCSSGKGIHRGDDSDFFINNSANPQAPMTPQDRLQNKGRRSTRGRREATDGVREQPESPEQILRRRARRFPKASLLDNPEGHPVLPDTNSLEANEAEVFDAIADTDASVMSLRDYRLSMFHVNSEVRDVPQSRLSNALSELHLQDEAVQGLYDDLTHTKHCLAATKLKLKDKKQKMKNQNASHLDVRAKLVSEKQCLHQKLQKESEANSLLKDKVTSLQSEVSRLRSHVQSTKSDLEETSIKLMEDWRKEESSWTSRLGSSDSVDNAEVVNSLRAEVADLEHRLDLQRMFENRLVSPDSDRSEVLRIRGYIEKTENDVGGLKHVTAVPSRNIEEMREALVKSEDALRLAREREKVLWKELEDTKLIVESLQQNTEIRRGVNTVEARQLKLHQEKLTEHAEVSRQQIDEELKQCKKEADELRDEIHRLSNKVAEEAHRTQDEASKRIKDQKEFETKLAEKGKETRSFQEIILSLEKRLAKAEEESKKHEHPPEKQESTQRQIAPESFIEPSWGVEDDSQFQTEVELVRGKLQTALSGTLDIEKSNSKCLELEHSNAEKQAMRTEITKTGMQIGSHEADLKMEEGGGDLEDKVIYLENQLELAGKKVKEELSRAEEEHRMAVETDAERLNEIARLKVELEMANSSRVTKVAVDYLSSRLDLSEIELKKCDKTASEKFVSEMKKLRKSIHTSSSLDEIVEDSPSLMSSSASCSSNDSYRSTHYKSLEGQVPTKHKVPTSPLSPPQLRYLRSPPSNGTRLFNVAEEEDDLVCSQYLDKSTRRMTSRQVNVKNFQRQFSDSNESLPFIEKNKFDEVQIKNDKTREEKDAIKSSVARVLNDLSLHPVSYPSMEPLKESLKDISHAFTSAVKNGMVPDTPHTMARSAISNTEVVLKHYSTDTEFDNNEDHKTPPRYFVM
eukprot:CAMPEP_0194240050 /NCGR_PEP_ID=MMETSP0158-20130606/6343_1 /TAXON_ID=33649 /ORGANISM="Thalassionema nitzschioides, Strain L26-B" /LENGTH=1064 /DNA_ID=CAMNT_0038974685 /DNA_START=44 /DNA_END=3238 /DNA_ORIENTATION=-